MCVVEVQALVQVCSFIVAVPVDLVSAFLHSAVQTCPFSPQLVCEFVVVLFVVSVLVSSDFVFFGEVWALVARDNPTKIAVVKINFFIFKVFKGLY
jgi:hypothetical protein